MTIHLQFNLDLTRLFLNPENTRADLADLEYMYHVDPVLAKRNFRSANIS
jgi:hypothetical protein